MNAIFPTNNSTRRSTDILNAVARMHARSLPMYLVDARPIDTARFPKEMATIEHIAFDHQETVNRIQELLTQRGSNLDRSGFPMEFTSLHDLSTQYLIRRLIEHQKRDIDQLQRYVVELQRDQQAQAIVEEALGAAKAHLDALHDLAALDRNTMTSK